MSGGPRVELTIEHFERWLDGQIAFGISMHTETAFIDHYLSQHSTQNPDDRLRALMKRTSRKVTAAELKDTLQAWNRNGESR